MSSRRRPPPPNAHPLRVPSLDEVAANTNPLRPVDSPTLGAATALSGFTIESPGVSAAEGFTMSQSGAIPSRLMPPPPLPPHPPSMQRCGSLSPNKRRRAPEDVAEGAEEPASSSSEHADAAAPNPLAEVAASIGGFLGFPPATAADEAGKSGVTVDAGDDFVPEAEEDGEGSPTKRQARTPAFGQAHAKATGVAKARQVESSAPPEITMVDVSSLLFGLSTLWLDDGFYQKYTNHGWWKAAELI